MRHLFSILGDVGGAAVIFGLLYIALAIL